MSMLGMNETIYQLVMANNVCWHGHALRMALDFEFEDERKRGRLKKTWKVE